MSLPWKVWAELGETAWRMKAWINTVRSLMRPGASVREFTAAANDLLYLNENNRPQKLDGLNG
jgi:hypothetical protein